MRPRLVAGVVLGLLALGCPRPEPVGDSKAASDSNVENDLDSPLPKPGPEPTRPSWIEPNRTHVLVQGHLPEQASMRVLPILLIEPPTSSSSTGPSSTRATGPSLATGRTLAAAPAPNWPDHFVARLGHGGGSRHVAVQGGPEGWRLEVWEVDGVAPTLAVELGPVLPAALTMVGDQVVLGQADTLAWIDLAAPTPTRVELHRRPEMVGKAYDLFVRRGSWLIAIDDQVSPIWADGFRLGIGKPEHVQAYELPSAINGSYFAGDLVATGDADGVLYLLLHYGIMDGHGHDLTALTIDAGKLDLDPSVLINASAGTDPPVLEEHVDRGTGEPKTLVAGTAYSEWASVVHVPGVLGGPPRLLISAGARGLLEVPAEFGPTSKASVIELGGAVVDAMLIGARVVALVTVEPPLVRCEVVELSLLPSGATIDRRTALPDVYQRFVH